MLQFIRSRVSSIFIKALFGVLIVSFAIWGIGDIFLGSPGGQAAIKVGNVTYNSAEVLSQFDRARRTVNRPQQYGENPDPEILDNVIESMVLTGLFESVGSDLGLMIGDQQLRDWIATAPAFRDPTGQFDPERFHQALFTAGLTEEGFMQTLRRELRQDQLASAVQTGLAPDDALVDSLFAYRGERRTINLVTIPYSSIDLPHPVPEASVRSHYEANSGDFMAPEYRRIALLSLSPDELASEIAIPEPELQDAYQQRMDEFITPATRQLLQFLFDDETAVRSALEQLVGPQDVGEIDETLTTAAGSQGRVDLGTVRRSEMADDKEVSAAFSTPVGQASDPVETPFGWKVFVVQGQTQEQVREFADVREILRSDIARDRALDAMFELANAVEDALAGGASLEEAAREIDITVHRIDDIDDAGRDRDNKPVSHVPAGRHFLRTVFDLNAGTQSDLLESDDGGYFIVRVDGVTAPALRPLEEVREQALAAWQATHRHDVAMERAQRIADNSTGGAELARAAEPYQLVVAPHGPFNRIGDGLDDNTIATDIPAIAFDLGRDQVGIANSDTAVFVFQVTDIIRVDPANEADLRDQIVAELSAGVRRDFAESFLTALRNEYAVTIDRGYIDNLMSEYQ